MNESIKLKKRTAKDPALTKAGHKLAELYTITRRDTGAELSRNDVTRLLRHALLGALVTLWIYLDDHIADDNTLDLPLDALDAEVCLDGLSASLPPKWLRKLDDGARVQFPGYVEENSLIAKKKRREDGKARQARHRAKIAAETGPGDGHGNGVGNGAHVRSVTPPITGDKSVTPALPPVIKASPSQSIRGHREEGSGDKTSDHDSSARATRTARAIRIPADFCLTPARRKVAEEEHVDPERTMSKFIDHWRSKGGQDARKNDWDATWRNWCRKEADILSRTPTQGGREDAAKRAVRLREEASWKRVKAYAAEIGCPLSVHPQEGPEAFESRVRDWHNSAPTMERRPVLTAEQILAQAELQRGAK